MKWKKTVHITRAPVFAAGVAGRLFLGAQAPLISVHLTSDSPLREISEVPDQSHENITSHYTVLPLIKRRLNAK
jgi:hypothetical protein